MLWRCNKTKEKKKRMRLEMESFGMFTLCIDVSDPKLSTCSASPFRSHSPHISLSYSIHILACSSTVKQLYKVFSSTYMHSSAL